MFSKEYYDQKYRVKWTRRPCWDYSKPAWYFVTICTEKWVRYFDNPAILKYAQECWLAVPAHFPYVRLGEWVVMPNHLHVVVWVQEYPKRQCDSAVEPQYIAALQKSKLTSRVENPTDETDFYQTITHKSHQYIPDIIRNFKGEITRYCNKNHYPFLWEARYHDHIIRTKSALFGIEKYIRENPENFEKDCFYVPN